MRQIEKIILHCTATKAGMDFSVKDITRWHRDRGFSTIGYHYVVYLDGSVHEGRNIEEIGAHAFGQNSNSIGICYVGGLDEIGNPRDTRTEAQKEGLRRIVSELKMKFPNATIHGHNEFASKACPCFNVQNEFAL